MYAIEKVFDYLIRAGLSEYEADMLIMQPLKEEAEDFVELFKKS